MLEDVAAKLEAVSDEIDAISAKRYAYDANVIAHGGVFVVLNHDGVPRLERGFVRSRKRRWPTCSPRMEVTGPPPTRRRRSREWRRRNENVNAAGRTRGG